MFLQRYNEWINSKVTSEEIKKTQEQRKKYLQTLGGN